MMGFGFSLTGKESDYRYDTLGGISLGKKGLAQSRQDAKVLFGVEFKLLTWIHYLSLLCGLARDPF
jgi:hypothetical protein